MSRRSVVTRSSDSWARAGSEGSILAHDDDLDRHVAIKVPNPNASLHPEDVEAYLERSPDPRQTGPSPHRAGP